MDLVYVIRHKVNHEGLSRREVARQLGISRNTVKKYLEQSEPTFNRKVQRSPYVLETVKDRIEQICLDWKNKTTQKQRITGTRVHRQLLLEGYQVGITTVRNYLREKRRLEAEVYIPLIHPPAESAQIDFFEVSLTINGVRQKAWMFLMRLMFSGRDFTWLYHSCEQASFFDGHVRAFEHFGGIPKRCVYDNLKPAVTKILGSKRVLNERFVALASHYLFEPCFARVGEGHDKGGVESRGKGIRLEHLVPIPEGKSIEAISSRLLEEMDENSLKKTDRKGKTTKQKFEEEKDKLQPLPTTPLESRQFLTKTISKQATVRIDGSNYSVPSTWKRLPATVLLGPTSVTIICQGKECHKRRVRPKQDNISYLDYLGELAKKPQALRQVSSQLLEELAPPFLRLWELLVGSHGELETARIFGKILKAVCVHGEETVSSAITECLESERAQLLSLGKIFREKETKRIELPESLASIEVESAKATDFDYLLWEERG